MTPRIGWGHKGDDFLHRNILSILIFKNLLPKFGVIQSFENYDPVGRMELQLGVKFFHKNIIRIE